MLSELLKLHNYPSFIPLISKNHPFPAHSLLNFWECSFKALEEDSEKSLKDTVQAALQQIEEKQYAAVLLAKGIPESRIQKYGFAFQGKKVLIGSPGREL